jgi:hypothetical protein
MTLYEADLDKIAVQVKSVSRKTKAPKEPKVEVEEKVKEPKKRAPRKRKVESEPIPEPEPTKPEPIAEPVPEPVAEKAPEPVAEVKEKKPRAKRVKRDPAEAPVWFNKYVEGVKKEQAALKPEKIPAKQVKDEAKEAAAKSWNHGLTRDRVQNEVDGHSMILLM